MILLNICTHGNFKDALHQLKAGTESSGKNGFYFVRQYVCEQVYVCIHATLEHIITYWREKVHNVLLGCLATGMGVGCGVHS